MNPHYEAIKKLVELNLTKNYTDVTWPWLFSIRLMGEQITFRGEYPNKDASVKDIMRHFTKYINSLGQENNENTNKN